jgi:hypothetical protein
MYTLFVPGEDSSQKKPGAFYIGLSKLETLLKMRKPGDEWPRLKDSRRF